MNKLSDWLPKRWSLEPHARPGDPGIPGLGSRSHPYTFAGSYDARCRFTDVGSTSNWQFSGGGQVSDGGTQVGQHQSETPGALDAASAQRGDGNALGLVVGTVPATPLQFSVGLAPGQYAQLDDVVVTRRALPGQGQVQIAGVVTNVEAMHEGARFASDVFLIEQGALPAEVCEVAEVTVTRVEPELYVPPLPGAPVSRAVGAQRESALYFDEMGASRVPVGFDRDGQPVYVNFEFLTSRTHSAAGRTASLASLVGGR
jgi:hypothetical protein